MHQELLRLAGQLAADDGGLPRWVSRNRAVSTAYYAVFHAIAERCARDLIGAWAPWPAFRHMYRSLDHGHAQTVFKGILSDPEFGENARIVGRVFIALQDQRHGADYDLGHRIAESAVARLIAQAERAIELLQDLPSVERKLLASRLIGRTRRK